MGGSMENNSCESRRLFGMLALFLSLSYTSIQLSGAIQSKYYRLVASGYFSDAAADISQPRIQVTHYVKLA